MSKSKEPKNSPTGSPTVFPVMEYKMDLRYLFQHLDAQPSDILYTLAESIYQEHLTPTTDDLKVAAIREAAEKVRKLEEMDDQIDEDPGTPDPV